MIDNIPTLDDAELKGKTVIVRVDLNSPIDPVTKKLKDISRIRSHIKTLEELSRKGAKTVILTHQGDPFDELENFTVVAEHSQILTELLKKKVDYIDDTYGPAAREKIKSLREGQILLLENTRYFSEDTRKFEDEKNETPKELAETLLVQKLYPLADIFVNDAFSASHRCQPSTVGFSQVLPSYAGRVMEDEVRSLSALVKNERKPCVFCLGGSKISDRFKMITAVLQKEIADLLLTSGLIGQLMLHASGYDLGEATESFITKRGFNNFIPACKQLLKDYGSKIKLPIDVAFEESGRKEIDIAGLPVHGLILDIGQKTAEEFSRVIRSAQTLFISGPPGAYEKSDFDYGTKTLFTAAAGSKAFTVAGGGNTEEVLNKLELCSKFSYVSTGGGALLRYLSGEKLAGIETLRREDLK